MEKEKTFKISLLIKIALLVIACILFGFAVRSCVNARTQDQFVIMSSSDMHGRYWDKDFQTNEEVPVNALSLSTAVKETKDQFDDRTVLFDNGDFYQGSLIESFNLTSEKAGQIKNVDPCTICLDEMKYDGFNLGNHEFDYKYSLVQENYEYIKENCSLVSANIYNAKTGERIFKPYFTKTFKVDGQFLKVGVIGLENTDCSLWDQSSHHQEILFHSPENTNGDLAYEIAKVQQEMAVADENCDFVVVSMHNGFFYEGVMQNVVFDAETERILKELSREPLAIGYNTEIQAYRTIRQTTGVDMFITGHDCNKSYSNMTFKDGQDKDVLVVNSGSTDLTKSVFRAKYNKENNKFDISLVNSENLPIINFEPDNILRKRIEPYVDYLFDNFANKDGQIVGEWTKNVNVKDYYVEQTDFVDLINRAQIWAGNRWAENSNKSVEDINRKLRNSLGENTNLQFKTDKISPDLSITPASENGEIKEIKNGAFTYKDAQKLYPENHYLCAIAITGADIKDMLEYNAEYKYKIVTDENGNKEINISGDLRTCPICYGLNFYYDMTRPIGDRVVIQGFSNGKAFDPNGVYCMMVNSSIVENSSNRVMARINRGCCIIDQELNHQGTYIRHILDLYATCTTINFGGVYPTKQAISNNENSSSWYIKY